jgi:hypothetical protein
MLARLLILCALLSAAPAFAQLQEGTPPPPFAALGPTSGAGLYAGIKDREGVAVSWVRVNGLKDKGELVPWIRGKWGESVVDVPLVDIAMAELYYSEGHIEADLHLLTGERMHLQLINAYTELHGLWRQNTYLVPLAGIRQVWFQYVPRGQTSADRYAGPTVNVRVQGTVRSVDLRPDGGFVSILTSRGEALDLRFDADKMRVGADLLGRRAPWMPGRAVRVLYVLSPTRDGRASREVREIELIKYEVNR